MCWLILIGTASEPFCVEASGVLEVGEPLSMKLKNYTEEGQCFDNVEFITEIDEA